MGKIDPKLLTEIYPAQKTPEELRKIKRRRNDSRVVRRSTHIRLKIGTIVFSMTILIMGYIYSFKAIFLSSLSGFSIAALLGLALVWLLYAAVGKIRDILDL